MLNVFGVLLVFVAVLKFECFVCFFFPFLTVHRKTHFLVNLYWDIKYSDSDRKTVQKLVSAAEYVLVRRAQWDSASIGCLGNGGTDIALLHVMHLTL